MAIKRYTCPPQTPSGEGTFSDNLVGLQLVQGGGLTQGNFQFTESVTEKTNRNFITGAFSEPINLDSLGISDINQSKLILEKNFRVYPNFDLTQVSNFTLYGSLSKRLETSIQKIISNFPAGLVSQFNKPNYTTGNTVYDIMYNPQMDETSFYLDIKTLSNPFDIDFTVDSTRNLSLREVSVSFLRNMSVEYTRYSLYFRNNEYKVLSIVPTTSPTSGSLKLFVSGNPFLGETQIYDTVVVRPDDVEVNKIFNEVLDEVENFLLNRNIIPKYTAVFKEPKEAEDGTYYVSERTVNWPLYDVWNLDILTNGFTNYLTIINSISENFDSFKTNLISRFLTTGAIKDFDTIGRKMEKVLQIYGRSFDDTRKYINALANMNSVHYNTGDDIPSQLLKNLAQTLGWNTNISPITNDDFLSSVFGTTNNQPSLYSGVGQSMTPDMLNIQFFKNIVLNAAWLFKSKGTRKSIESLLRLIGAPDALVEFNEYVYVADQRININQFETQYARISGGTYTQETPILETNNLFSIQGEQYTGFTTNTTFTDVNITRDEYPIDELGFPKTPENTESFYFQLGSGWYEQTPSHRSNEDVDLTNSVFTGSNPNYQTTLSPFTYGQIYLDRFRNLPYTTLGFNLEPTIDNNKSWTNNEVGLRSNLDGNLNALYSVSDDRLVLNVKNVDLFINPSQGLSYDVWYMSRKDNFPIPNDGLKYYDEPTYCNPNPYVEYPQRGGVDWTEINPQPSKKTFFEFAQTFWKNMINVRNRQFSTNGKSMGYPTLESIYWKYLESEKLINIKNDNFTYRTMIEYVNGLGSYWIKLVEQMIPATTIWNTGVKYENSIFHRQKFVWRRQEGCQIEPIPCRPCIGTANLNPIDCPFEFVQCDRYPTDDYNVILSKLVQQVVPNLTLCDQNGLSSEWFIELLINDMVVVSYPFFNGVGMSNSQYSYPTDYDWEFSLTQALNSLANFGYDYSYTEGDFVVVYNSVCSVSDVGFNFKINLKINFDIYCNE